MRGCACAPAAAAAVPAPGAVELIAAGELRRELERGGGPWLLHGPGTDDHARGHIPGAVAVADLADLPKLVRPGDEVVVYGHGPWCPAPLVVLAALRPVRTSRCRWFRGGLDGWRRHGGTVEPR